jgi:hypothetical protein
MDAEWKWRENYRVWDANRRIFLYSENWTEPELRLPDESFISLYASRNEESPAVKSLPLVRQLQRVLIEDEQQHQNARIFH